MSNCKKICCYANIPSNKQYCNNLINLTENQLIYNNIISIYAKLIDNINNKCSSKKCQTTQKNELPYASSFEELLKMKKAEVLYNNPLYR